MQNTKISVGSREEVTHRDTLKAALAEFISTLIFVFASRGSGMAFNKLTHNSSLTPSGLIAAAIAHAFSLFVAVSGICNISKGHLNPAVTFGMFIGGKITLLRGILFWIAQLLGSVVACLLVKFVTNGMVNLVACLLLKFVTNGMTITAYALSSNVSVWNALVLEIVMTFGLVYTVYATAGDRNAPIAIGFIVGTNILVRGAFDGGSMNPAESFGAAVVSWSWSNHWVYWIGPLIGGGLAAIVYKSFFISTSHEPPTTNH